MTKMSRTLFAIGTTLTAALAVASTVWAALPATVCPGNPPSGANNVMNWPAPDGHWHTADCWIGSDYDHGFTIARGRAYHPIEPGAVNPGGVDLQAYLFGGFGAVSGRIHGW